MHKTSATFVIAAFGATLLAGCSSDGGLLGSALTTQSISTNPSTTTVAAAAPKVDPACYSLAQRIEMLRKEGVTDRLEKASVGKSSTVSVKRASLAQAAELDKANAEFQAKCSAPGVRPAQTAQAAPIATGTVPPVANSAQVVPASAPKASIAPPVVHQQ